MKGTFAIVTIIYIIGTCLVFAGAGNMILKHSIIALVLGIIGLVAWFILSIYIFTKILK